MKYPEATESLHEVIPLCTKPADVNWLRALYDTLHFGEEYPNRGGVTTIAKQGSQPLHYHSAHNIFPIITVKKVHWESVRTELAWFLDGRSDIESLNKRGVKIWNEWSVDGHVKGVYGKQWRFSKGFDSNVKPKTVDQIAILIEGLKSDPFGRRHIISAWHPADIALGNVALPACHTLAQWHVTKNGNLNCSLYQRSADLFLGVPFNMASYALLNNLIAQVTGLKPGMIVHTFGNMHVYSNHLDAIKEMCNNIKNTVPTDVGCTIMELNTPQLELPEHAWEYDKCNALSTYVDSWNLVGYNPLPAVKAPVTV